jgi:hypothetical protein
MYHYFPDTPHIYLWGYVATPFVGNAVLRRKTSVHILWECKTLVSLRHTYLGFLFLDPEDIRELGMGAI